MGDGSCHLPARGVTLRSCGSFDCDLEAELGELSHKAVGGSETIGAVEVIGAECPPR